MSPSSNAVHNYGFTALPADASTLQPSNSSPPSVVPVASTPIPPTPLALRIQSYAREKLPRQTLHHSMRVYHYGLAIAREKFPAWGFDKGGALEETYFLTCMLHDIGTTHDNLRATRLSFEFYGGLLALDVLQHAPDQKVEAEAPVPQAESVAEAIIRHQDLCTKGTITTVGQLVQLATIFDNVGGHEALVNKGTIEDVVKAWPREGWSGCFARTIREENGLKPWAHTTALGEEDFPNGVLGNKLMAPWD